MAADLYPRALIGSSFGSRVVIGDRLAAREELDRCCLREWPGGGVAAWAGAAVSVSVCGTLETHGLTLSGNRSFQVCVQAEVWETPDLQGYSPGVWEGRRTRESPSLSPGRPGGGRGSPRRPASPSLSASALLRQELRYERSAPSPSAAFPKKKRAEAQAPSEVGLDPWPPRCEL